LQNRKKKRIGDEEGWERGRERERERERESSPNGVERGHLINGDHHGRPLDTRRNAIDVEGGRSFPEDWYTGGLSFHK